MSIAQKIRSKVGRFEAGSVFQYEQLGISNDEYQAAAKTMQRLVARQTVKKVSKGVFYKPKQTSFGELKPKEEELLKPYMYEKGKRVAYVTGTSLYNRMGLTTQVPQTVTLASKKRISTRVNGIKVKSVKSYIDISERNVAMLEILDSLKDFSNIPDIDKKRGLSLIKSRISKVSRKDKLTKYALEYPPRVRALLGAILSEEGSSVNLTKLKESLNPLSTYDYGLGQSDLSSVQYWNIV